MTAENDDFAIGYYQQADLGFYGHAMPYWTTFDRYFSATLAETYPNRFYQHSAQTDRIHNSTAIATMPTIWDRLAAKGVSHAYYYYYVDVPLLGAVIPGTTVPLGTRSQQGRKEGQARPLHDRPMSALPHARNAGGWPGRVGRQPDPPTDGRRRVLPVPWLDVEESVSRR